MKTKLIAVSLFVAASAFAGSAFAAQSDAAKAAQKVYQLKDGKTLYQFNNGKMALENRFGNVEHLQNGQVLETADGQKVTAVGNETALLRSLLNVGNDA